LRIAQVAPLYESVPPRTYGGTERVISYLTEELVRQGHDVTLFASGDSVTSARLVACCRRALRLDRSCVDPIAPHIRMLGQIGRVARAFDIIHFHIDYLHFPLSRRAHWPQVTTLHGRLDIPELVPLYREFPEMPLVSVSDAQRTSLPWVHWCGTVHNGVPADLYGQGEGSGGYLAFVGRIAPEKRVDRAIEIARRLDMPLKIAAKVDKADEEYFEAEIRPRLNHSLVKFVGEIGEDQKKAFLGNAYALLFPIDWPEPFGMAMIEAMACGTPIVAYRRGSVPEVIEDGISGFIVDAIEEAVHATRRAGRLSRRRVREAFENRFTAARMARGYVAVYEKILESRVPHAIHNGRLARLGRVAADGRSDPIRA
jgi:glycosyltransferase involved in cell wall biosynthesis